MKENILDGFLADIKKHLPFKIVFEMAEVWEQENKEKITPPKNRTPRQIIPHPGSSSQGREAVLHANTGQKSFQCYCGQQTSSPAWGWSLQPRCLASPGKGWL